jgi:hypothetical protein
VRSPAKRYSACRWKIGDVAICVCFAGKTVPQSRNARAKLRNGKMIQRLTLIFRASQSIEKSKLRDWFRSRCHLGRFQARNGSNSFINPRSAAAAAWKFGSPGRVGRGAGRRFQARPGRRQCPASEVRESLPQPLTRTSEAKGHEQLYDSRAVFRFEVPGMSSPQPVQELQIGGTSCRRWRPEGYPCCRRSGWPYRRLRWHR